MTTLLPPESTSTEELAVSESVADWWDLDPSIIATVWDPMRAPVQVLPFLANALQVPVWREDWPEETKRKMIRTAIIVSRLAGTRRGYEMASRMAGAELVKAVFPPDKMYLAPSLTADEREEFVRRYPELRVYDFRSNGEGGVGMFMSCDFLSDPTQPSGERASSFPYVSDAIARLGKQGYVYNQGVETPLKTAVRDRDEVVGEAVDYTEVRKPGVACGIFMGEPLDGYLVDHEARRRIYRMRLTQRYVTTEDRVHYNTVKPGLDWLGYEAEPVAVKGDAGSVFFSCGSFIGDPLIKSDAGDRLYSRTWLFDPSVSVQSRGYSTHLGDARLGMPRFNAELTVKVRDKRPVEQSMEFIYGFFCASDPNRLDDVYNALEFASLGRDKVMITTKTIEPILAGKTLAGDALAGDYQEAI